MKNSSKFQPSPFFQELSRVHDDPLETILSYHEATKHHYNRFAKGPGYLDWATQPDPFRRFEGAPLIGLPMRVADDTPPYRALFEPDAIAPRWLDPKTLSRFLELSLAVSAWKQAGDARWALRCNPSSGNLHPTEGYLVLDAMAGFSETPGVYHYAVKEHALEGRCPLAEPVFRDLMRDFPAGVFLAGLSSIHWREAWKYGERAFRYCQHDIGHALGACRIAAAALGWKLVVLEAVTDPQLATLLGLEREADFEGAEREHPDLLCAVLTRPGEGTVPHGWQVPNAAALRASSWSGRANRLSVETRPWDFVDLAAEAAWLPNPPARAEAPPFQGADVSPLPVRQTPRLTRVTAGQIIRQRRSAVAFDGVTGMDADAFYAALAHTVQPLAFDAVSWPPRIHLCLFVHRVAGLDPGLYFLLRDPAKLEDLRARTRAEFLWRRPEGCPAGLHLYLLNQGDFQAQAARVSCTQEIAGQSAFSLGMIAEYADPLQQGGPWLYRRLFWESGLVGQMLYLAAEYLGLRSTGIGCYFDDPVHDLLGLKDNAYQSLYHFTVGGAVEDKRLTTLAAYAWSCDLPAGRFPSRTGPAEEAALEHRARALSQNATCAWRGRRLSRIGLGARRLARHHREHTRAVDAFLASPLNVIETAPDLTSGEEEILIGDALNRWVDAGAAPGAEALFFVVHAGMMQGEAAYLAEVRKQRGRPFDRITPLENGLRHCLDPEFLDDQLERTRRRLGIGAPDLLLLRIPEALPEILGRPACLDHLRRVGEFLQTQCDAGRLGAFGISSGPPALDSAHPGFVPLDALLETFAGLAGFGALAFHGNVVEDGAFRSENGGPSLVARAKEQQLLVLAGGPLAARWQGEAAVLADCPAPDAEAEAARWDWIARELASWENEVHGAAMADGRTLKELLQQAAIASPFTIRRFVEPARRFMPPSPAAAEQVIENIQNVLKHARGLGEQLAQARLWDPQHLNACMDSLEVYLDDICQIMKRRGGVVAGANLGKLRDRFFPGNESRSLQTLGIHWLWDQGVDVVLTGLRRTAYLEEALEISRSYQGAGQKF